MFANTCRIISFLILFLLATPAHAEQTGNDLLRGCTAMSKTADGNEQSIDDITSSLYWAGYISGFVDSYQITYPGNKPTLFCVPQQGIENGQMARIVIKYLNDNPKDLHQSARLCLIHSLQDAFPCKK
jgi:hypothetical protein